MSALKDRMRARTHGRGGASKAKAAPETRTPVEAKDTLFSHALFRGIFLAGEGPMKNVLKNGLRSLYLDGVRVMNPDGTLNFNNVQWEVRNGYPDQTYIPGYPAVETEVGVSQPVTFSTSVTRTIEDTTATAARVTITVPQLVQINSSNGDQYESEFNFDIGVQATGAPGFTIYGPFNVRGKCVSPYQRSYRVPLEGNGPWQLRVRRYTQDPPNSYTRNAFEWSSYTVIRDWRFSYADSAIVAIAIDASNFTSFPQVEAESEGLLVRVPTNYDPHLRVYTGVWNGEFKTDFTDNPAWIFHAMLENDRWGLGQFIDTELIDKWSLYEVGRWCDGDAPNGRGGTEPRFRYNGAIDTAEDAYRVLALVAGAFNSMVYWSSNGVTLVADRPGDPVALVTPSNVVDGKITYTGSSISTKPTSVNVRWRDPEYSYSLRTESVEDPARVNEWGLRITEPVALGCTSQGQAARVARHELETAWGDNQGATWTAGWDQRRYNPGDLVRVADPSVMGVRRGGRLAAVDTANARVTLDSPVELDPVVGYTLRVMGPDGELQARSVLVFSAGSHSELQLASALDPAPEPGSVWVLDATTAEARIFKIITIEELDTPEPQFRVSALSHDPNKQTRVETGLDLEQVSYSEYPTGQVQAPSNLSYLETIRFASSGALEHVVTLSWRAPSDPRVRYYEVEYFRPTDLGFVSAGTSQGLAAEVRDAGSGPVQFRVRAVGADGSPSGWATATFVLLGFDATPSNVTNFRISVLGDVSNLSWDPATGTSISHYEIRFSPDTTVTAWEAAPVLVERATGTTFQVPTRSGTYLIKAVSLAGVYSALPALISSDIASVLGINVVELVVGAPDWTGVHDQTIVDPDRLALRLGLQADWFDRTDYFDWTDWFGDDGVYSEGVFTFDEKVDLGAKHTARLSAIIDALGERITDDFFAPADMFAQDDIFGDEPAGWDVRLEFRTTDDDPNGLTPTWTDWMPFVVSDVAARGFEFRVLLSTTDNFVTPIVENVTITVDMPDRVVAGNDIFVPAAGLRISFVPPFIVPPEGLGVAVQDQVQGDYYVITGKDATGFDVQFFNAANVAVGRTMDYVAKGYGAQL